jgi:hypothetical protein
MMRAETGPQAPLDAESTAVRVLRWAGANLFSTAPPAPPLGPLFRPRSLLSPGEATVAALSELLRDTAARLGAGWPPFGDSGQPGLGALFLAAAIGGWEEEKAAVLLAEAIRPPQLVPEGNPPGTWAECFARHAVVAPMMFAPVFKRYDSDDVLKNPKKAAEREEQLTELLLRMSPLTSVLHRPALRTTRGDAAEAAAATVLLARPRSTRLLQSALSQWSADVAVLKWRAELLQRFALSTSAQQRAAAVDTYVMARLRHGPEWDRRLASATAMLSKRGKPDEGAIATVRYWAPLRTICDNDLDLIRARPYLTGYEPVLRLVRRHRLTATGTP